MKALLLKQPFCFLFSTGLNVISLPNQQRNHNAANQFLSNRTKPEISMCTGREQQIADHPLTRQAQERHSTIVPNLSPLHYINLTNGLELLSLSLPPSSIRFTRIQSSHCESGAYDKILSYLDNDLLFNLSLGRTCYIYDLGSRHKKMCIPRALFLGVEFVKWALAYLWFDAEYPHLVPEKVLVRGKNLVPFWRNDILMYKIGGDTKKRLRYYKPFVKEMGVNNIALHAVYGRCTEIDGCMPIHVKMARKWIEAQQDADEQVGEEWMQRNGLIIHDAERTFDDLVAIQSNLADATGENTLDDAQQR